MTNKEKANVLVLKCIMTLNKCDIESAIKFAGHNQICYNLAMAVAQAKEEDAKAEKQALIDKACEFISKHIESDKYIFPDEESYKMGCGIDYFETNMFIEDLKNYMKGGNNE